MCDFPFAPYPEDKIPANHVVRMGCTICSGGPVITFFYFDTLRGYCADHTPCDSFGKPVTLLSDAPLAAFDLSDSDAYQRGYVVERVDITDGNKVLFVQPCHHQRDMRTRGKGSVPPVCTCLKG